MKAEDTGRGLTIGVGAIALVALLLGVLAFTANGDVVAGGSNNAAEVASKCAGSTFPLSIQQHYAINESATGVLGCAVVQLSQLGGESDCPPGEFAVTMVNGIVCSAVDYSQLTGIPNMVYNLTQGSQTVTGKVIFSNSTSIGVDISGQTVTFDVLNVAWSKIAGFPSGCSAGQFVTAIGTTLTCAAAAQEAASNPTACGTDLFATEVVESSAGVLTLTCGRNENPNQILPCFGSICQNMVGYWPLDEGSGISAYDLSGNGNTGTLVNSPTWQNGINCEFGGCLEFVISAISDEKITFTPSVNFPNGAAVGSFFAWEKVVSQTGGMPLSTISGSGVGTWRSLAVDYGGAHILYFSSNANDCQTGTIANIDDGNFHLVGYTYNGGTSMNFWEDGTDYPCTLPNPLNTNPLGGLIGGNTLYFPPALGGTIIIDEPRYYNIALTSTQINQLYTYGLEYHNQ